MNNVQGLLGAVLGMVVGVLLHQLPSRLFYRNATWVTEEYLSVFPDKKWVVASRYVSVPLGFALWVALMMSTDLSKGFNTFFFFPVFFCCLGAAPAVPELFAKTSVLIPVGHHGGTNLFTFSPSASRAGALRLALASLVVAVLLWCR